MSEQVPENPQQAVQSGAPDTGEQPPTTAPEQQQTQDTSQVSSEPTFPIRLVKRPTGDIHWNVAKGIYETMVHGETGEPMQEYALLATIDGVDVTLQSYNAGGIETIVKSQQQAQQGG